MKKVLIIIISFTTFGCWNSENLEDKKEIKKSNHELDLDLDLEKKRLEFRELNKVSYDIDSLNFYYSIEFEKFLNKNIYCDSFLINDFYKKDSLYYMSIDADEKYHLDLEISEKQFNSIYNPIRKENTSLLEVLDSYGRKNLIVFNLKYLYKIKDSISITNSSFKGYGKLVDYKNIK
jgi:hypothetical protein